MRIRVLSLIAAITMLFAGCTASSQQPTLTTAPEPTTTAEPAEQDDLDNTEPATLEELADEVATRGLVDSASFQVFAGNPEVLSVQLYWDDPLRPSDQVSAFTEIDALIDDVLGERPEVTQIVVNSTRDDGNDAIITAAYDPGPSVLLAMLTTVADSLCTTATLDHRDLGEGSRAIVDLSCYVDSTDAMGLVAAYDEITALRVEVEGVDETHWEVSLAGQPATNATMRLDAGPIEGRQQLFVEVMTSAVQEGADRFTVIDAGNAITIVGFADAAQSHLCAPMLDHILASGVEHASVSLQLRDTTPNDWACRVTS